MVMVSMQVSAQRLVDSECGGVAVHKRILRQILVQDPAGNLIELFQPAAR